MSADLRPLMSNAFDNSRLRSGVRECHSGARRRAASHLDPREIPSRGGALSTRPVDCAARAPPVPPAEDPSARRLAARADPGDRARLREVALLQPARRLVADEQDAVSRLQQRVVVGQQLERAAGAPASAPRHAAAPFGWSDPPPGGRSGTGAAAFWKNAANMPGCMHVAFERPCAAARRRRLRRRTRSSVAAATAASASRSCAMKRPSIGVFSTCRHSCTISSDCTNLRLARAASTSARSCMWFWRMMTKMSGRTRRASVVAPRLTASMSDPATSASALSMPGVAQNVLGVVAVQQASVAGRPRSRGSIAFHSMPSRSSTSATAWPNRPKPDQHPAAPRRLHAARNRRTRRRRQPLLDLQDLRRAQAHAEIRRERLERIDRPARRRTIPG